MKQYITILQNCPLFRQLTQEEILHILHCFEAKPRQYVASDYLIMQGDIVDFIGIVLEGSLEIIKENIAGDRHIVTTLSPSDLFGEGIVCTKQRIAPVTVTTKTNAVILTIPYQKIIHTCNHACTFHSSIIHNMMLLLGEKNHILNQKMDLLLLKGIKEKLAAFLLSKKLETGKCQFTIPLNRNELAEYLNVSRPSMSRELAIFKEEGILDYHKNTFRILDEERLASYLESTRN